MPTFVRIHEAAVSSFIMPGGEVSDLVLDVATNAREFARNYIHSRTGALAASLQRNYPKPDSSLKTSTIVFARTKYAGWVHEGVEGRITPKHGRFLAIPKNVAAVEKGGDLRRIWYASGGTNAERGPKTFRLVESVRGQDSNPYLAKGLRDAMALL